MRGTSLQCGTVLLAFTLGSPLYAATLGTLEATYSFHSNGLLADPDRPYMYATNGSTLEVINTNTLAVTSTVSLPGTGNGMALSSDNNTLYVGGSTGVYEISTSSDTLQTSLNLGYPITASICFEHPKKTRDAVAESTRAVLKNGESRLIVESTKMMSGNRAIKSRTTIDAIKTTMETVSFRGM